MLPFFVSQDMTFELATLLALIIVLLFREVIHYRQTSKLQELLKASDITEYYRAKNKEAPPTVAPSTNTVMNEENDIAVESPDFDIRKVSEVIIDGQKKPINII
jgi:hypothetical protein